MSASKFCTTNSITFKISKELLGRRGRVSVISLTLLILRLVDDDDDNNGGGDGEEEVAVLLCDFF